MDHSKSKIEVAAEEISDALVYDSLRKQGCTKTAKKLLRIRKATRFLNLQGVELHDLVQDQKVHIKSEIELATEGISDALVYESLIKQGYTKTAKKLLKIRKST